MSRHTTLTCDVCNPWGDLSDEVGVQTAYDDYALTEAGWAEVATEDDGYLDVCVECMKAWALR